MAFDSAYKFIIAWNVSTMVIYPYYRPTGSNAFLVSQATGIGFCLLGILLPYSFVQATQLKHWLLEFFDVSRKSSIAAWLSHFPWFQICVALVTLDSSLHILQRLSMPETHFRVSYILTNAKYWHSLSTLLTLSLLQPIAFQTKVYCAVSAQ